MSSFIAHVDSENAGPNISRWIFRHFASPIFIASIMHLPDEISAELINLLKIREMDLSRGFHTKDGMEKLPLDQLVTPH
jgi:hypothetical protein